VDDQIAIAQTLKYAEELRDLYAKERGQRRRAEEALARLREAYGTTVLALSVALDLRDDQTGGHAERVASLALELTRTATSDLAEDPQLEYGFLLHDVGKIGIPDAILLKPGPLTAAERAEMETHTYLGERIVARVPYLGGLARQIVASHHERWDGTGYPSRLGGQQIPLAARIFALADAWDAMTNDRPYRNAMPIDRARQEIENGTGTQFDPALVGPFLDLVGRRWAA
jgi:HD-GYP domain-containing protein (c-di-GMP phosphodiesterase class II)